MIILKLFKLNNFNLKILYLNFYIISNILKHENPIKISNIQKKMSILPNVCKNCLEKEGKNICTGCRNEFYCSKVKKYLNYINKIYNPIHLYK
jgi:hypothetical protein